MDTVQSGDYEMIFDAGGMEDGGWEMSLDEYSDDHAGTDGDGTTGPVPEPTVLSNVLHPNNGQSTKDSSRITSHATRFPISHSLTTPVQSPPGMSPFMAETNMDRKRLRTRPDPKPIPAEVSEAIALMDQEIRDHHEGPPKKRGRGRPKGWRKGQAATATAASKSGSGTPSAGNGNGTAIKKRGRPSKIPALSMRAIYLKSEPNYIPFGCEWFDPDEFPESGGKCLAELHNMETLRRHIYLVHGHEGPISCKWGKCAEQDDPEEFDWRGWLRHIKNHLVPYAWHMGDGIRNRGIDTTKKDDPEKLPDYLFRDGEQITPSVRDQQFEDTAGMLERRRKLREIRLQAEENAPTEREFKLQLLGKQVPPRLKRKET
ncbi:hypothetical protein SUNI508_03518 [Seiridium unicorne]|uniref:Uncharacterized protein n=1 Tax=Seiridium unicorne TaxID=138068 RepID=A0ABR2VCJ2_9PEZI